MISLFNSKAWSNLEFPLTRKYFSISSRNFNSSIKTTFIVCISNCSSKSYISSNRTIVRTLVSWKSRIRPSIWSSLETILLLKKNVFLLNTEPWFFIFFSIKNFLSIFSKICISWFKIFESSISP